MATEAEIERLRLEADTIMTRYEALEQAFQKARTTSGDHWERGELLVTLETTQGETIELSLDFESDPATHAQQRYERANELEAKLERKEQIVSQLQPLPPEPLAYLICYHLDTVEGNYPKSIAGYLDAERGQIESFCETMRETGLLERVESGTVKQRRVKAKKTDEVRQHHTYYRLSRQGDHLLRFLTERQGQRNVFLHLPDGQTVVSRLCEHGADSPRKTATDLGMEFESVRHLYRALRRVGLLTKCDNTTSSNATCYAVTDRGEAIADDLALVESD